MDITAGKLTHGLIFLLGLILMAVGIATQTKGAPIIGLIIAAINFRHWQMANKGRVVIDNDQTNE